MLVYSLALDIPLLRLYYAPHHAIVPYSLVNTLPRAKFLAGAFHEALLRMSPGTKVFFLPLYSVTQTKLWLLLELSGTPSVL